MRIVMKISSKDQHSRSDVFMFIWWWRHQVETFSVLLAICAGNSPVPGEFPTQRPVTRCFDFSFDLRLNGWWLSKQWWGWWFETLSWPSWRHYNDVNTCIWVSISIMTAFIYYCPVLGISCIICIWRMCNASMVYPCNVMCQNRVGTNPLLAALDKYQADSGSLRHGYSDLDISYLFQSSKTKRSNYVYSQINHSGLHILHSSIYIYIYIYI